MTHIRPVQLLVLGGILFVGAIIFSAVLLLSNLHDRALTESSRELNNIVLVLSEQTDRTIRATELIEDSLIERMHALGVSSPEDYERVMSGYDMHLFLKEKVAGWPHIGSLTLINSTGNLFNFSRSWPLPKIEVTDREFFKVLQSNAQINTFMGEPVRNRATGSWTIHLVRRVAGPQGEFLGLILGAMEMQYFEECFATINLGQQSSISLFRDDGILLASHPSPDPTSARSYAENAGLMKILAATKEGTVEERTVIDDADQLIAARKLQHYPFVLMARTPVAAALTGWVRELQVGVTAAGLLILITGGIVYLGVRQFRNYELFSKARTEQAESESARAMAEAKLLKQERLILLEHEARREAADAAISSFRQSVERILTRIGDSVAEMKSTAVALSAAAAESSVRAKDAVQVSNDASASVGEAKSAAKELSHSVEEIATRLGQASELVRVATTEASTTNRNISELALAANEIGDIVKLIEEVASQTNLLALNATIEAARAGVAGKGFAVVASEVKSLAVQTGKATQQIAAQVAAMQRATTDAVDGIQRNADLLREINEHTSTVAAAVRQQNMAAEIISRNVKMAAEGTNIAVAVLDEFAATTANACSSADTVIATSGAVQDAAAELRAETNKFLGTVAA
jgi:methyl-accepting chemotaxis protein